MVVDSVQSSDILRVDKNIKQLLTFKDSRYLPKTETNGEFISTKDNKTVLAKRVEVELTLDTSNPCSYVNEDLAYAIDYILTEDYAPQLYIDGEQVAYTYLGWHIDRYARAVVLSKPLNVDSKLTLSFVKYVGQTLEEKALLSDGSTMMDGGYWPKWALDIATKEYSDSFLDRAVQTDLTIEKSTVTATQSISSKGIYWNDGKTYDVMYCDAPSNEAIHVEISKFVDQYENLSGSKLELYLNDTLYKSSPTDEITPTSLVFTLLSSEDPYASFPVGAGYFLYKSYSYDIPLSDISYDKGNPFLKIQFKIRNLVNGKVQESKSLTIGLEEHYITDYVFSSLCNAEFKVDSTPLEQACDTTISTVKVISTQKQIALPHTESGKIWQNFYPTDKAIEVSCVESGEYTSFTYKDLAQAYQDAFSNASTITIDLTTLKDALMNSLTLIATFYNLNHEIIYSAEEDLSAYVDFKSDESNRVTVPSSEERLPVGDYGAEFSTKDTLDYWDMRLVDGVYKSLNEEAYSTNSICLKVSDDESYTHIRLTFDTTMPAADVLSSTSIQVLSEGNTGWLNCDTYYDGVSTPTEDEAPAEVASKSWYNDRFITFGRKAYKSPIYIRLSGFKDLSNIKVSKAN